MFNFGFSSGLGGRDSSTNKARRSISDDNWYIPYNGPYEAPPRNISPRRRKQRDSWGDPIPFSVTTNNLQLSGDEDTSGERKLRQQYESHNIRYGAQGVFDDDWKGVVTSGVGFGVVSDRERGRCVSYGRDQRPSSFGHSDPVKNIFSTSRRRSTVSSANTPTVPDYMPLDGVSGGVGESPVPRRAQKDVNRISLGSIFTFGARMRMGSPTRSMDYAEERVDNFDVRPIRPSSNPEKERFSKLSNHVTLSGKQSRNVERNKSTGHYVLSNGKEDYHDYLYSTLAVDDNNGALENQESHHRPASPGEDSRIERPGQTRSRPRVGSRQNLTTTSVGHPYAPYAHQNQSQPYHDRSPKDEKLPSPASDDASLRHQRHPYNQARPAYSCHPYGQSSVSTGASSPSNITTSQKRGSDRSENHGECQQALLHANATPIGITNSGVVGVGLGAGVDGKKLKISRSTPNFRRAQIIDATNPAAGPSNPIHQTALPMPSLHTRPLPPSRPKEKWLSAETWCDALLFPRPRLKIKQGKSAALYSQADESFIGGPAPSASGRIVSPPPSPLGGEWDIEISEDAQLQSRLRDQPGEVNSEGVAVQKPREPGIPSRVLAHSRSFDLQRRSRKEKAGCTSDIESRAVRRGKAKAMVRDRRDAQDMLPPPTPVADLNEVLSEGRLLDEERQAWQMLAVNSLGNKRSRSLSRTRTKSLTRHGRVSMRKAQRNTGTDDSDGQERRGQSSFEYLAAQACLGNQTTVGCSASSHPDSKTFGGPASGLSQNNSTGIGNDSGAVGGLHSPSNSHLTAPKAVTAKLSKSQPQAHSRDNSTGNSMLHPGRISVSKLCGSLGLEVNLHHVEKVNLVGNGASAPQGPNIKTAPDLEGALKKHGTKVIRLADPAHIPVDKGLPVSESVSPNIPVQRGRTPSPHLSVSDSSVISQSKVGIAIGTPEEAEGLNMGLVPIPAGPFAVSASYVPSHPYAQGGLSFSVPTSSSGKEPQTDSRSPPEAHTPVVSGSKIPPLSEILARHKFSHPYASISGNTAHDQNIQLTPRLGIKVARDSYLDANGLIGRFRSDDRHPDPSRMWAQLSPDAVREILPDDLRYSPYDSDVKGIEKLEGSRTSGLHKDERMRSIYDTPGVAEALLGTTGYRTGRNVVVEEHKAEDRDENRSMQPDLHNPSHPSSAHTIASSYLDPAANSPIRLESLDCLETASSARTSPPPAFRPLGSPNDLDSYQDLFYQPSTIDVQYSASPDDTVNMVSWDAAIRDRRTGSGLTSLARQLSEEYEALASVHASRASSMHLHSRSRSLGAEPLHSGASALSTDGNLQFVLEDMASTETLDRMPNKHETIRAFESANLPEDVYSLQASSVTDGNGEDDDPTGLLRLGTVESLATPLAVDDVEHRISFNGETIYEYADQDAPASERAVGLSSQAMEHRMEIEPEYADIAVSRRDLLAAGLPSRPLTQVTRSSYMTTSDLSGLSDFPVPPKSIYSEQLESSMPTPTVRHINAFTYFEDDRDNYDPTRPNNPASRAEGVEPPSGSPRSSLVLSHDLNIPGGGQVEFGVNQNAVELARSLSSPELM